jgi:hypothetical protein
MTKFGETEEGAEPDEYHEQHRGADQETLHCPERTRQKLTHIINCS